MMKLRASTKTDMQALRALHLASFSADEGLTIVELVKALLHDPTAEPRLSLVVEYNGQVVGHVLVTSGKISNHSVRILAPLAVLPEMQRRGIGGKLIEHSLERLRADEAGLVFVYGDPNYYMRHRFEPAIPHHLYPPHAIPETYHDAWMVQALRPDLLGQVTGTLVCADALMPEMYWL